MSFLKSAQPLGRVFGVEVRAHTSLLWFLGIGAVLLTIFSGPAALPGAALVVLGLILSVTLHELGHIGAASLFGNGTTGITLTPIGGVAELEREARSPREEVVVALAGPAVSLMLAGAAAIPLAFAGPSLIAEWFLRMNLVLALFNLIPAFPMDGGRVLRGFLWGRKGYLAASESAARTGQAVGVVMGLSGLVLSPMLIAIGIFVFWQASEELRRLRLLRYAQALEQGGFGLDALAALFGGGPAPRAPGSTSHPTQHTTMAPPSSWPARPGSPFSRVEFRVGPDGRPVVVDRSPW
ncbi:MAG: M50 family metallopeptidase [Planctomycetota bacterium]